MNKSVVVCHVIALFLVVNIVIGNISLIFAINVPKFASLFVVISCEKHFVITSGINFLYFCSVIQDKSFWFKKYEKTTLIKFVGLELICTWWNPLNAVILYCIW